MGRTPLALEKVHNFRDLGGLATTAGRQTRYGRLYRSARLNKMTRGDAESLAELEIEEVHDLRLPDEVASHPTKRFGPFRTFAYGLNVIDLDVIFDAARSDRDDFTAADSVAVIRSGYGSALERLAPGFGDLLQRLAQQRDGAALIHCMTGKDRTGVAVALVLSTLGVEQRLIVEDYETSGAFVDPDRETELFSRHLEAETGRPVRRDVIRPVFESRAEYIRATLTNLDDEFGGTGNYVLHRLGLSAQDLDALRARFLMS